MADNIGGVEFRVGLDGKKLPAEAAVQGRIAGEAMGHEFAEGFDNGVRVENFGDLIEGLFAKLSPNATKSLRSVGREYDTAGSKANRFASAVKASGDDGLWNKLSFNARQAVVIIGAIAGASGDIANLGIAAGGGLAILGAAAADAAVGGAVAVAAFSELTKSIDDIPDSLKPAAKSFKSIGDAFKQVREDIANAAFDGAVGAFDSLRGTVLALSPALQKVGGVLGDLIDQFAAGIAPGTDAFNDLNNLILESAPNLQKLGTAAGKLGKALLSGLANKRLQKAVGDLLDGIGGIGDAIHKFTVDGGLDDWVKNTEDVFSHFNPLLEAAGQAIGKLVTKENLKNLDDFLDHLTSFMGPLGDLLGAVSKLDIFGLIAQALDDLGRVIQPLIGPLGDLFEGLKRVLSITFDEWGKDLEPIAKALGPVVKNMGDFLKTLDPNLIKVTADAILIFAGAVAAQKLLGGISGLVGKLGNLKNAFKGTGKEATTAGKKVANGFGAALSGAAAGAIASDFSNTLTDKLGKIEINGIDFKPAAQGAINQFSGTLAGAAEGARWGGPVGAMIGGIAGALASIDWGTVTSVLTDPNYKGTKAIQEGFKQGPFFGLVELIKTDPDLPKKAGNALGTALSKMWDFAGEVMGAPFDWVNKNIISPITQAFSPENFGTTWQLAAGLITGPFETIAPWFQEHVATPLKDFATNPFGGIEDVWTTTVEPWLATTFGPIWVWVQTYVLTPLQNFATNPLGGIQDAWTTTVEPWVSNTFSPVWTWVQTYVLTPLENFATNPLGGIQDAWATVSTWVSNTFGPAWAWVDQNVVSPIRNFVSNPLGGISSAWGSLSTWVSNTFGPVWTWVQQHVINPIRSFLSNPLGGLGGSLASLFGNGHAAGALVMGPERALIGEAGPEMVVPLARPLNQVDPAVRRVAAFAQGKPVSDGSGAPSIGKQVNVSEGAIVVAGVSNGQLAATTALDQLVKKL